MLIELIRERALQRGQFTLSSGKTSSYYLDCRKLTLSWEGAREVAERVKDILFRQFPAANALAGPTIGADPIIGSVLMISQIKGLLVRKEAKDHGTKSLIEGPFVRGDRVVVVEDVCTTGQSAMRVVNILEDAGAHVLGVICVIDRSEGASELFRQNKLHFCSLVDIRELVL